MRNLLFILIMMSSIFGISACDFFKDQGSVDSLMGKQSKIYDAYKQGKCLLEDALKPLSKEQRKIIANLIAKSYTSDNY